MKPLVSITALVVVSTLVVMGFSGCTGQQKNTIIITGADALVPIMQIWADQYMKLYPNVNITVSGGGAGKGVTDALSGASNIGMVSRELKSTEISQGVFYVAAVRDAVVVVVNEHNPVKDILLAKGLTKQQLRDIFTSKTLTTSRSVKTWGQLVNVTNVTDPIVVISRTDSAGSADTFAKYLGNFVQQNLTYGADSNVQGDSGVRGAILNQTNNAGNDRIGYNNLNTAYNMKTKLPYPGLVVVPYDLNGDGILEANESFYGNTTVLVHAIETGMMPTPPAKDNYLVTKGNFTGATKDFVTWILSSTGGQLYIASTGYCQLPAAELTLQQQIVQSGHRST